MSGDCGLSVGHANGRVDLRLALETDAAIAEVIGACGARLLSLSKSEPSLEDAFIRRTGRRIDQDESAGRSPRG